MNYPEKSGTLEATLEILRLHMEMEIKYSNPADASAQFLQEQIDYITKQLKRAGE